jgi:hypothetical protein
LPTLANSPAPALPEALPVPQQIARMDADRLRAYRENLDFYHGRQWLEPRLRRERRLTFNYARTVIEKTASYTMAGVTSVVDPEDASPEALARARRTEEALREVYDADALDQLDFDSEIDCSVLGDGAYKVTWDAVAKRVRISAPDVHGLFAWPLATTRPLLARRFPLRPYAGRGGDGVRSGAAAAKGGAHGRGSLDGLRFRGVD